MSYLKKGRKASLIQERKKIHKEILSFNVIIKEMNKVYALLITDDTLTEENIEQKIKDSTTFKFNELQMDLLIKNLLKNDK